MVLLDTPSLIWWINHQPELSPRALGAIEAERPDGTILLSAVAAWEVAHWATQNRLALRMDPAAWLAHITALPNVRLVPIDQTLAIQAAQLPEPAPQSLALRLLAATARQFGCPLLTASPALQAYPHIKILW